MTFDQKLWLFVSFQWERLHAEYEGDSLMQFILVGWELSYVLKIALVVFLIVVALSNVFG
jgi:hypothetical protein